MFANNRKYSQFLVKITLIVTKKEFLTYLVNFILIFLYTANMNIGGMKGETPWQDLTYEIKVIYSEI